MSAMHDVFLDVPPNSTLESLESYGTGFAIWQRGVMWWTGDLARYAEARFPDTWPQVFPEWMSPGMIARASAVAKAYPREEDRNPLATWSIHMQNANRPDRIQRVQAHVEAGRTSDEARQADQEERSKDTRTRWLLAVDVNYYTHRFWFSGAGVEAAVGVASWVQRTVARLKEKGLTDVACCFDSTTNHRKALTTEWEDKYKDRPPKEPELIQQITLVRELLEAHGFACVSHEGMEADDYMASFAAQFDGRVTLVSQDKDVRQSLSAKCNILLDVEWSEDETTGDAVPEYKWLSVATHVGETGLTPAQFLEAQILMGDSVDNVKGAPGIGVKGASDLIKEFGSAKAVIDAAKAEDERIKPKTREALIEFEPKADITRQLVTLRTTLPLPQTTRV